MLHEIIFCKIFITLKWQECVLLRMFHCALVIKEIKSCHFSVPELMFQRHSEGSGCVCPAIRGQKKVIRSSFRGKVQGQEFDMKRLLC